MTHDELLKDLTDKHNYHIGEHTQVVSVSGCNTCETYYALRAVVELCKDPEDFGNGIALIRVSELIQAIKEQIK